MAETILQRWARLDALMESKRVIAACREAVQALEAIAPLGGDAGEMAAAAILRAEEALTAEVDLDA